MLQIKVFNAWTADGIEKKVNSFLEENPGVKIQDLKFSTAETGYAVMIILED